MVARASLVQPPVRARDQPGLYSTRRAVVVYGATIVAVLAAVLMRWLLDPVLVDQLPLVTLYGAVAAALWWGGYRPALVAWPRDIWPATTCSWSLVTAWP